MAFAGSSTIFGEFGVNLEADDEKASCRSDSLNCTANWSVETGDERKHSSPILVKKSSIDVMSDCKSS